MKRLTAIVTWAAVWASLTCALLPAAARATDANPADANGPWSAALGGGVWLHPRFPGSDSTYAQPLPYFDVHYGRLFLVTGDGLGAYLFHTQGAWAAVSIAPELRQRWESDDERLHGLGDVRRTARAEFQAGYAAGCFTAPRTIPSAGDCKSRAGSPRSGQIGCSTTRFTALPRHRAWHPGFPNIPRAAAWTSCACFSAPASPSIATGSPSAALPPYI